jgi:glycerol dehydrogenase
VAFGVLTGLHLTDAPSQEIETVYSFCEDIGLPTTLADIGLGDADRGKLAVAAESACAPEQSIHHEAGGITPARVLEPCCRRTLAATTEKTPEWYSVVISGWCLQ